MSRYTFDSSFDTLFTIERVNYELEKEGEPPVADLENFFDFAPHRSFTLPKNDGEFRIISVPERKAKVIQRILYTAMSPNFRFSNRNYAYQQGKSPIKAVNRARDISVHFDFVIKCDIASFFDSIDHELLFTILERHVRDEKIRYLLAIFIKNGSLFKGEWHDKLAGVYQGDVLSPFLANLYLDSFDRYFERRGVEFVRFADDMLFFAGSFDDAVRLRGEIEAQLEKLHLRLNEEKSYIVHKYKGFEYLGIRFDPARRRLSIDNERLMKKISMLSRETKNLSLEDAVEKINEHVRGFHQYYKQVVNNSDQFELLQEREEEIVVTKIIEAKRSGRITRKGDFMAIVSRLKTYRYKERFAYYLVERAYETMRMRTPERTAQKTIDRKKSKYFRNRLKRTELIVSKVGTYLSFAKGKIKLKTDEGVEFVPINVIERIIITNTRVTLSAYLIRKCAQNSIDIDFIERDTPYALLTYYNTVAGQLHISQIKMIFSPLGLEQAKNLHKAKARNQLNLLKYFNLRRRDKAILERIEKIEKLIKKIPEVSDKKRLMGIEGVISSHYWYAFGVLIGQKGFVRTHKESKDAVNQALNYGYAILYNKIQSALIREGLNIYYPFLHSEARSKPTLVYDFIEPFRQPIVDRAVIALLSRGVKLETDGKLLSDKSKKRVTQAVQERLGSFSKTRYGKTSYLNLIGFEANAYKRAIKSRKIHRFFVAKY